jgi:hypothetical protein
MQRQVDTVQDLSFYRSAGVEDLPYGLQMHNHRHDHGHNDRHNNRQRRIRSHGRRSALTRSGA